MQSTAGLEQTLLDHLRQLPPDQQREVLDFAEFLHQKLPRQVFPQPSLQQLEQLASLPLSQRHQVLAPFIAATAQDFKTDPVLTEFSVLDGEDWEFPDDEP
ncbi:DUF2281 domain-containing protein [Leptolyngbya sp. CCNP1308]|uniref:DUF2281 domain-containing protein n=1 Tax=Leptolyngbya sp. CCNP1308 TaxID=3110255 RepID=UPI002B1F6FD1|nr:DUF2281 domain-containing protein [Leptolyngbya sp. CCNP1308]MEA5448188.1 DUF2281 domain-containing protein [Leptolyngbya sp. CCNP1308]